METRATRRCQRFVFMFILLVGAHPKAFVVRQAAFGLGFLLAVSEVEPTLLVHKRIRRPVASRLVRFALKSPRSLFNMDYLEHVLPVPRCIDLNFP